MKAKKYLISLLDRYSKDGKKIDGTSTKIASKS